MSLIAGIVIAASGGRRVGGPEALLRTGEMLLVDRAVDTATEAGCDPVVVVLGAAADEVLDTAALRGATVLVNKAWGTGLGSSLRMALESLDGEDKVEAALVMPVDMPGLTVDAIRRVTALPFPEALVCATYGGLRNYPMLFGRRHWAGISTLAKADVGARPYLLAHKNEIVDIACDTVADGSRIDSPERVTAFGLTVPAQRAG